MKGIVFCMFATLMVALAERKTYEGYNIFRVTVNGPKQAEALQRLENAGYLEILKMHRKQSMAEVWVGEEGLEQAVKSLNPYGMRFYLHPTARNVPEKIASEFKRLDERYAKDRYAFDLDDFNTYDAMITQIDVWAESCSFVGLYCYTQDLGYSHEGRIQRMLIIRKSGTDNPVIYLEHTIHAREWLSASTIQKFIDKVITGYGTDQEVTDLVDNHDLYIVPIANPDGYVKSWESDRMWRKNVRPNPGFPCPGTDLNRNFDSHWATQGASHNTCAQTYNGPSAASEIETQNLEAGMKGITKPILAVFAVHCCADMWMFPYGFTEDYTSWTPCAHTDNHDNLNTVAEEAVNAIGQNWAYGTVCEVIYPATGDTANYGYDEVGCRYTFAIELHGNFIADKSEIGPVANDFWLGFMASIDGIHRIEG